MYPWPRHIKNGRNAKPDAPGPERQKAAGRKGRGQGPPALGHIAGRGRAVGAEQAVRFNTAHSRQGIPEGRVPQGARAKEEGPQSFDRGPIHFGAEGETRLDIVFGCLCACNSLEFSQISID